VDSAECDQRTGRRINGAEGQRASTHLLARDLRGFQRLRGSLRNPNNYYDLGNLLFARQSTQSSPVFRSHPNCDDSRSSWILWSCWLQEDPYGAETYYAQHLRYNDPVPLVNLSRASGRVLGFRGGVSESTGFPCWPHRSDVSAWDCPAEDADQTALIASIQQTAKIHPQVAQRDQPVPQSSCEQP